MSLPDLAIHSKRILLNGEMKDATLYIHEGKIVEIKEGKGGADKVKKKAIIIINEIIGEIKTKPRIATI